MDYYRQALRLQPDSWQVQTALGMTLLALGQYAEGWDLYEHRIPALGLQEPPASFPRWRGESLAGKSIFITREQGLGDEIQFCRYARVLKELGARRVTWLCRPELQALLRTLPDIDAVVTGDEPLDAAAYDYWTLPLSVPGYCKTTLQNIPANLPYLSASPERLQKWRARIPPAPLRVGLVWRGAKQTSQDNYRSLPGLSVLEPLWRALGPSALFFSLQKGDGEEEGRDPPADQPLLHVGAELNDFADTAAVASLMDVVICVDTAVAHLAGALGRPCWILLSSQGVDWRWMQVRTDSPWYPSVVRLFRQPEPQDWTAVVKDVVRALESLAAGKGP